MKLLTTTTIFRIRAISSANSIFYRNVSAQSQNLSDKYQQLVSQGPIEFGSLFTYANVAGSNTIM